MIKELVLKNFKIFNSPTKIPLSDINLLTGINGRGKSTVLQAFLLMKQSPEFDRTTDKLIFNGSYVQLGNIKDVKNVKSSQRDPIEFGFSYSFEDASFDLLYQFNALSDDSLDAIVDSIEISNAKGVCSIQILKKDGLSIAKKNNSEIEFPFFLFNLFIRGDNIDVDIKNIENHINLSRVHYVSADRIGPKLYYSKNSISDFASVGSLGQNSVNVLWHKRNDSVYENLCEDKDLPRTVFPQTEYWVNKIFDGARLSLNEISNTNLISFRISTNNSTDYFVPTNVGFGYSYILPIIISSLIAKKGEILIVENPEAHIHLFAQSILAKLLTLVSQNGVQVFIESHSEHILNGLRIPIFDGLIKNNNLNVLYFDKEQENIFTKIEIDEKGGIQDWPPNFFDQATKDFNYLFGL